MTCKLMGVILIILVDIVASLDKGVISYQHVGTHKRVLPQRVVTDC
jgi:hypothetical protein